MSKNNDSKKQSVFITITKCILINIYKFLYLSGVQSVRVSKRINKKIKKFFTPFAEFVKRMHFYLVKSKIINFKNSLGYVKKEIGVGFARVALSSKRGLFASIAEFFKLFLRGFKYYKKAFSLVFNIVTPIVCFYYFMVTLNQIQSYNYAIEVSYNGAEVGYVESEEVLVSATAMVYDRLNTDIDLSQDSVSPVINTTFALTAVNDENMLTDINVCDSIVSKVNTGIENAAGLYVNGDLIGSSKSELDLEYILQRILNTTIGEVGHGATAEFVDDVEIIKGSYPTNQLVDASVIMDSLTSKTQENLYYDVQAGDTILGIAAKYNMTQADLVKLNPNMNTKVIKVGQTFLVSASKSTLPVQAVIEESYTKPIDYETEKIETDKLYLGQAQVSVEGEKGEEEIVDKVYYIDGLEVNRENVSTTTLKAPVNQEVLVGTKKKVVVTTPKPPTVTTTPTTPSKPSTGRLIWPVNGSLSRGYGYYGGVLHDAIDIMGSYGTPIKAADSGVVVSAGWHYGYGWNMTIQHSNGMTTFYAHMSKLNYSAGASVGQGTVIGGVGSTGSWSTGPHLHFEVLINGRNVNPLSYL